MSAETPITDLDWGRVPSPCFVVDRRLLERNGRILARVRAEAGCIEYYPAIDIDTGLDRQSLDHNLITIVEKWSDVESWKNHLTTPHLRAYHQQVKDMVEGVTLKVLQPV